jgi:hypothetical protein
MMLVSSAIASAQETVQRIPYDYLGGSGLGPEELLNKLLLKPGTESTVISWAMVQSAQALQLSFTDKSSTEPALVPNVWHSTGEPVPLKDEVIARHNTEFPQLRLDPSITYGLQIQVHYFVANGNALTVGSKAVLFARGNNSPFKPFKRPYSGDFFARDFLSATLKKLDVLQKLQSPAWL